ncbi:hypothetical protein H7F33_05760 [Pedobacter sp. PAMC26386]|nr:hypothetical protein H7F33_05760 [Pedobacter sp. PAMC26386]
MSRYIYKSLSTFILTLCISTVFGQTPALEKDNRKEDGAPLLKIGINYLNNSVFMGRSDTAQTAVISPNMKYVFASGIYISGSIDYLPNTKTKKINGGDLAAGYILSMTDNLDLGFSFTKLFYSSNSTQIASSQSATANISLDYDIADIITPSVSLDYAFNKRGFGNDIFLSAGLSHDFIKEDLFGGSGVLIIAPMFIFNAGTQNFYDAYLVGKKFKNANKTAAEQKIIDAQKRDLSKFKLLDYEFSVPITYKVNHFIFTFIPTYSIAQNKLPASITSNLSNKSRLFNFEIGAAFKF